MSDTSDDERLDQLLCGLAGRYERLYHTQADFYHAVNILARALNPHIDPQALASVLASVVDLMAVGAAARQAELDRRVDEVKRDVGPLAFPLPD